ncbi:HEAT repeat domain-containing protein [Stratiformator vulcanicus]|nr:HEAT repeat domain-containing protein [Stratiformator vulcanicus]
MLAIVAFAALPDGAQADEPDVSALIAGLDSEERQDQLAAIVALGELGPFAEAAVPKLAKFLSGEDLVLQHEAAIALGRMGQSARSTVPDLLPLLKTDSPVLQHSSIVALGRIGEKSDEVLSGLESFLTAESAYLRLAAANSLVSIGVDGEKRGEVIDVLIDELNNQKITVRADASYALSRIGEPAAMPLTKAIAESDPITSIYATEALSGIGSAASGAVGPLKNLINSENPQLRASAVRCLAAISENYVPEVASLTEDKAVPVRLAVASAMGEFAAVSPEEVVEPLKTLLQDPDDSVQIEAITAAGRLGSQAGPLVPLLVDDLMSSEPARALAATDSLASIGKPAVDALAEALNQMQSRALALSALSQIGPDAAPATPRILDLLDEADGDLLTEIFVAIADIGKKAGPQAVERLVEYAKNPKNERRAGAVYALGNIGDADAVPLLKQLVNDTSEDLLPLAASYSLVQLKPDDEAVASSAIPLFIAKLDHEVPRVRVELARMLGEIGPRAAVAKSALAARLSDSSPDVQGEAVVALAKIGAIGPDLLPTVVKLLESPTPSVRYAAAYALGLAGKSASEVVPVFVQNLNSRDEFEKLISAWALVKITDGGPKPDESVEILLTGLQHPEPKIRAGVVDALAIFADRDDVTEALRQHLETESDSDVKAEIEKALGSK